MTKRLCSKWTPGNHAKELIRKRRRSRTPRSPIDKKKVRRTPETVSVGRESSSKMYTRNQEKGAQGTGKEKPAPIMLWNVAWCLGRGYRKESLRRSCLSMANSRKTEKNGRTNFNDIAMKFFWGSWRMREVQEGRIEYFKRRRRPTVPEERARGWVHNLLGLTSTSKNVGKQGRRTRRCYSKRDEQTVTTGKFYIVTKYLQNWCWGDSGGTKLMEDREACLFFENQTQSHTKRCAKAISPYVFLCLGRRRNPKAGRHWWHQLSAPWGDDGQLLQKHWEWQGDRRPMMRHGSVIRPTKYLASASSRSSTWRDQSTLRKLWEIIMFFDGLLL